MDTLVLARTKMRLERWLDSVCRPHIVTPRLDAAMFGEAYVTFDRTNPGPAASGNFNRVTLCGADPGMTASTVNSYIELFQAEGAERFFVWLMPGPRRDEVRGWLLAAGMIRGIWTGYPTLTRGVQPPAAVATDLTIREVGRDDVLQAHLALGEATWAARLASYVQSAGAKDFTHFLAYDGETPVATAALAVFEGLGYLGFASTAEPHRRRGAQQALIAARLRKAAELGCQTCVSDTLTMLETSLNNLRRAGFEEAFETEVYGWENERVETTT
jgi:GNAT superfamily N-acetyltransferase